MTLTRLRIKRLDPSIPLPRYATEGASGLDLHAAGSGIIPPGGQARIPTGLCLEIPLGLEGQVRPRSGLASRGIVGVLGTIDADYRGEIAVILENRSRESWIFHCGDRIAQLVIAPVVRVRVVEAEELSATDRGSRGFGSTGVRAQEPRATAAEGGSCGASEIGAPGGAGGSEGVA